MTTLIDPENALLDWISATLQIEKKKLKMHTTINLELGVDGDDGVEFLNDFCLEFRVDPNVLDSNIYFGPEASATIVDMLKVIFRRETQFCENLTPLTIGMLLDKVRSAEQNESI